MLRQLINRVALSIPVVLFVLLLGFTMLVFVPSDPAALAAGDMAGPEVVAQIRKEMGLDQSVAVQFARYIARVAHGDLGKSLINRTDVGTELFDKLGPTVELAVASLALAILIGVPLGMAAASCRGTIIDSTISMVAVAGISTPVFMPGLLLIQLVASHGGFLPIQGRAGPPWTVAGLSSLVMPALTLAVVLFGPIARLTRATMIDVLASNFVRTANAKGLPRRDVLIRHGLRNAAIPIVTLIGLLAGYLLGGAVVTEAVFAWPGLGQLTVTAISSGDYPMAQGGVLMLTLSFVFINILTDLGCAMLDPRLRS